MGAMHLTEPSGDAERPSMWPDRTNLIHDAPYDRGSWPSRPASTVTPTDSMAGAPSFSERPLTFPIGKSYTFPVGK